MGTAALKKDWTRFLVTFALAATLAALQVFCPCARADWEGGHDVMGATEPADTWYFAEGTTRAGFDEWLCLQNPGDRGANAEVTYMLEDGENIERSYSLSPHSRTTVDVRVEVGRETDLSLAVSADRPLVAERPMYFRYKGIWTGGHDVMGATEPADTWYFAEGSCRPGFEPYLCLGNPREDAASVKITYMLGDGNTLEQPLTVPGMSRRTVSVADTLGVGDDPSHDFSCRVQTAEETPVVVERPTYFAYGPTAHWTLAAVGDVNLGGDMVPTLQAYGYDYPWSNTGDLLRGTTLTFANLECTISHRGEPVPGKAFTFRGPPDGLPPMREAGVDVVSQGNNHARDYGGVALTDSLGYLEAYGIEHCGAGADYESAHTPAYLDAGGLRVAFLGYDNIGYGGWSGWWAGSGYPGVAHDTDTGRMAADIAAAKSQADLVVVSCHWGIEKQYTPNQWQTDLAHYAVDCGADLVLGHHPHVVQGFELYKGKLIAYSLGNFVFNPGSAECRYTILTHLAMDSEGFLSATIYPVYIASGRPQLMAGGDADALLGRIAGLSHALGTPMTVGGGVATIP